MIWNPEQIRLDFLRVARTAGIDMQPDAICVEILQMPHKPPSCLPNGKVAVYIFSTNNCVLKVGKADKNTKARYTYQHYNPRSSNSNLAKSILNDGARWQGHSLTEANVGKWIKKNTDRVNFLFDATVSKKKWVLNLLEVFVQCRLEPIYEGR